MKNQMKTKDELKEILEKHQINVTGLKTPFD